MGAQDLAIVTAAVREVPTSWYPGGWPGEIEAALIDAILSIRAAYGSPTTGVRAAITRYRTHRDVEPLDDLAALSARPAEELSRVLRNAQKTAGRSKASAVVEAAARLVDAGVTTAADFDATNAEQRRAYTAVRGLGDVTWAYLGMCLGKPGVKADIWIVRFVSRAVGREVSPQTAGGLVLKAADSLGLDATAVDHSIWRAMRTTTRRAG